MNQVRRISRPITITIWNRVVAFAPMKLIAPKTRASATAMTLIGASLKNRVM